MSQGFKSANTSNQGNRGPNQNPSQMNLLPTGDPNISENIQEPAEKELSLEEKNDLMLASFRSWKPNKDTSFVEYYISQGVSVNLQDADNKSLLILAAEKGSLPLIKKLLNFKADWRLKDRFGKTALLCAIDSNYENTELVRALLDYGAEVNQEGPDRVTPLLKAVDRGHANIVRLLLHRGANVQSYTESTGDTPLHMAVKRENLEIIKLLFEFDCDPTKKNRKKQTALDLCQNHNGELYGELIKLSNHQQLKQSNIIEKAIQTPHYQKESSPDENKTTPVFSDVINQFDNTNRRSKENPKSQKNEKGNYKKNNKNKNDGSEFYLRSHPSNSDQQYGDNQYNSDYNPRSPNTLDEVQSNASTTYSFHPQEVNLLGTQYIKDDYPSMTQNSNKLQQPVQTRKRNISGNSAISGHSAASANSDKFSADSGSNTSFTTLTSNEHVQQNSNSSNYANSPGKSNYKKGQNYQNQQFNQGYKNQGNMNQNMQQNNPTGHNNNPNFNNNPNNSDDPNNPGKKKGKNQPRNNNPNNQGGFNKNFQNNNPNNQQFVNNQFNNMNPSSPNLQPKNDYNNMQGQNPNQNNPNQGGYPKGFKNQNRQYNNDRVNTSPNINYNQNIPNINIQQMAQEFMNKSQASDDTTKTDQKSTGMGFGPNQNMMVNGPGFYVQMPLSFIPVPKNGNFNPLPQPFFHPQMFGKNVILQPGLNFHGQPVFDGSTPTNGKQQIHLNMKDNSQQENLKLNANYMSLMKGHNEQKEALEKAIQEKNDLRYWVDSLRNNESKMKEIIKEKDNQMELFQRRIDELENTIRRVKPGGLPEMHDKSSITEDVFDDLASMDSLLQETKPNPDMWKANIVSNILHEEVLAFEKAVNNYNKDKAPLFDSLINSIKEVVEESAPGSECCIYGSFATGLCLPWSDIDIVIKLAPNLQGSYPNNSAILDVIGQKIQTKKWFEEIKHIKNTTVPVLKITCTKTYLNKKVDISIQENRHNGLSCVELVKEYLGYYPPLRPLVLFLKQFLFYLNLNDTYSGGLSSYGLILMIVYLFQSKEPRATNAIETQNLGSLILSFLSCYGFDYDYVNLLAVTPRKVVKGKEKPPYDMNSPEHYNLLNMIGQTGPYMVEPKIVIQDPLSSTNNVGRSTFHIKEIKNSFMAAYFEAFQPCLCEIHKSYEMTSKKPVKCCTLFKRMLLAYQPNKM